LCHEVGGFLVGQLLGERAPGGEGECVGDGCAGPASGGASGWSPGHEDLVDCSHVFAEAGEELGQDRHRRLVAQDVVEHQPCAGVVGIELGKGGLEAFVRVDDRRPGHRVWRLVLALPVDRAGDDEGGFVLEVAVDGGAADARPLGHGDDRRLGGADGCMELDRSLEDPLPRLRLRFGALLLLVCPFFGSHICRSN